MNPLAVLHDVLQRLVEHHGALQTLKERERAAVLRVDLDALDACNREQDRIQVDLVIQEQRRRQAVAHLAEAWGAVPEALTLSAICARLPNDEAEPLRALGQTLAERVETVRRLNDTNRTLVEHALEFVKDAVRWLAGSAGLGQTYTARGEVGPPPGGPMVLDRRV